MKKFSVILLIAVLAMTSVFAVDSTFAISGSASAEYTVDFNDGTFGYTAPDKEGLDLTLTFTGATAAKNEAGEKFWAEMTAAATIKQTVADKDAISPKIALTLSTFKLHYADVWAINMLKAEELTNLAKSSLTSVKYTATGATTAYGAVANFDSSYSLKDAKGITFDWTKTGFKFAGAVNGGLKPTDATSVLASVKTPTFTLAKGFTLNGAGGFGYTYTPAAKGALPVEAGWYLKGTTTKVTPSDIKDIYFDGTDIVYGEGATKKAIEYKAAAAAGKDSLESMKWNIAASLALAYASEDGKIAVSAATDQNIGFGFANGAKTKLTYGVDADVKMTFSAATAEVYYAKDAVAKNDTPATIATIKNLLSATATMDLNMFNPAIKATFTGLNLLHKSSILSTELEVKLGTNFTINAYAKDILGTIKRFNAAKGEDKVFYGFNYEGQKVGVKSTMVFGAVTVKPEVYTRIALKQLGYGVAAEYKNAYFTVTGGVDGYFTCKKDAKKSYFGVNAGIEAADTIVKNATVGATYASKNLLMKNKAMVNPLADYRTDIAAKNYGLGAGSLTLSCEIEF